MTDILRDCVRAVAFLSRLPMPKAVFQGYDGRLAGTVRCFPLAALPIVFPGACLLFLLLVFGADPLMAALLALALQILVTGALHEDGLSDCADGLAAPVSRQRSLEIMKDSRIGVFGALALILSLSLRATALAALARTVSPGCVLAAMLAVGAVSRAALVWHWRRLPLARPDGVASSVGQPAETEMQAALVTGVLLAAVLLWPFLGPLALVSALLAAAVSTLAFTAYVRQRLGGHTGDTLGATQQIVEALALCALAMAH